MRVYRIVDAKYGTDLTGEGARIFGGRWNSPGHAAVYTASNSSLAMLEKLVYVHSDIFMHSQVLMTIEIPDHLPVSELQVADLPQNWDAISHPLEIVHRGDAFIKEGSAIALKIPSAINFRDANVMLNPRHPNINEVEILSVEPLLFDDRLFKTVLG
jgi:RES domain-containing protein